MKNKKWFTYTISVLLTLIALAIVGMAGFRAGVMQNAYFPFMTNGERPAFDQKFDKNDPRVEGATPGNDKDDKFTGHPQGGERSHDFNGRGFDRGRGGMSIFGGLFRLVHLALLGLLLWFGYKLVKNNGWRIVRVQTETSPETPEPDKPHVEEKNKTE